MHPPSLHLRVNARMGLRTGPRPHCLPLPQRIDDKDEATHPELSLNGVGSDQGKHPKRTQQSLGASLGASKSRDD